MFLKMLLKKKLLKENSNIEKITDDIFSHVFSLIISYAITYVIWQGPKQIFVTKYLEVNIKKC